MRKMSFIFLFSLLTIVLSSCGKTSDNTIKEASVIYTTPSDTIKEERPTTEETNSFVNIEPVEDNQITEEQETKEDEEPELEELEPENPILEVNDDYFDLVDFLNSTEIDCLYYPTEEKPAYTAEYGEWQIDIYTTKVDKPTIVLNDARTSSRNIQYCFESDDYSTIVVDKENNISIYKIELEPLEYIIKALISTRQENLPPGEVPLIQGFVYD